MGTETTPAPPTAQERGALRLLAATATGVLLIALLVLPNGPSEHTETLSWLLAIAVAVPAGLLLGARQEAALAGAAPAATARALAAGAALLALGLLVRRTGTGDRLHAAIPGLAALGALAAPRLAASLWRRPDDRDTGLAIGAGLVALAFGLLLFLPAGARHAGTLSAALALAALMLLLLRLRLRSPGTRLTLVFDLVVCAGLLGAVVQLPEINIYTPDVILHHGFFLGPANDVLHGRAMVGSAWSQYGVGLIDALGLAFTVVPIGFGTLALIIVALTAAQFLCVYATVRLAGVGQLLAVLTIAVAVLGNLFAPLESYLVFPSVSPLRFGLPYLMILAAVLGARFPARAPVARASILAILALGAVWSFESFIYCAGTYGAIELVEALVAGTGAWRRLLRAVAVGLAVSAVAVLAFSLLTLAFDGHLDWGPYLEYLKLYSTEGFGQLPVVFFSAGPLMGAAIFASAVTVFWLARERPAALEPPLRAAVAGFTGFAIVSFTYYLGRSHPNNLLVLLVPVVALGGLWAQALVRAGEGRWRLAPLATIALAAAMIAVAAWPSVRGKWRDTAVGLVVPGHQRSLRFAFDQLSHNPVLDPLAPAGEALLDERLPPGAPALVLAEPDLTTEILMRSGRRNLLPISHPPEDVLIDSSRKRVVAASDSVPAGTLLLTSPGVNELELAALVALHRRFAFQPVASAPGGPRLFRLARR